MYSLPQRELKIRAYDDVHHVMYYLGEEENIVFTFGSTGIIAEDIREEEEEFRTLHHLKYMQYVGLDDKNGEPIYEGDVLEFPSRSFHSDEVVKAVVYTNEYAEISVGGWLLNKINRHATKIGNIYEMPELLGDYHE